MSNHKHTASQNHEHGTVSSYVIGFMLSLILTLIPYYLVVSHKFKGGLLLATILGFAVLQMIIQITFFLHLGRGPKPRWNLFFFVATVGIILIVVGGSMIIINNLHYNMLPPDQVRKLVDDEGIYAIGGQKTGACQGQHPNHQLTIINGLMQPAHTDAKLCDTLTIISDNKVRQISFGEHDHHKSYAGNTELIVSRGKNKTITLSQLGTYIIHDHLDDQATGTFTVAN